MSTISTAQASATDINRTKRGRTIQRFWTSAPHELTRSADLSANAKLVWILIRGFSDDYQWTRAELQTFANIGHHALRKSMVELQKAGWLEKEQIRNDDGTFGDVAWIIHESTGSTESVRPVESTGSTESVRPVESCLSVVESTTYEESTGSTESVRPVEPSESRAESSVQVPLARASKKEQEKQSRATTTKNMAMTFPEFEAMSIKRLYGVNISHPPYRTLEVLQNHTRDQIESAFDATSKSNKPSFAYFAKVLENQSAGVEQQTAHKPLTSGERNLAKQYRDFVKLGMPIDDEKQALVDRLERELS